MKTLVYFVRFNRNWAGIGRCAGSFNRCRPGEVRKLSALIWLRVRDIPAEVVHASFHGLTVGIHVMGGHWIVHDVRYEFSTDQMNSAGREQAVR